MPLAIEKTTSMRLFTGIALAPEVVDRLSALLHELKPLARVNWSPVENLHITCKFIGAWPEDRLDELQCALDALKPNGAIPITISHLRFFPHSFFAGVQSGPALPKLAAEIENTLTPLGIKREDRVYTPHVTLARIKRGAEVRNLQKRVADLETTNFGSFEASEFHLYLSKPGPRGSTYTKLATYHL
jgi:2'-5' RNA ligase